MHRSHRAVWGSILIASAFTVPPSPTHAQDPFQSAPVAPAAPRPAPRSYPAPRPREAVPPPAMVPAPTQPAGASVPPLPSTGQIWSRVRQVAQAEGIAVPLASSPPINEAGTPPQYRGLLGAWGPAAWQGSPAGDKIILVVQGVDAGGTVQAVAAISSGDTFPAMWQPSTSPMAGGRFSVRFDFALENRFHGQIANISRSWEFELRSDGRLYGLRNDRQSSITLSRLQ